MTSESKTTGDIKHNFASTSRSTKKSHLEDSDKHNKKNENRSQGKSTDNKEKTLLLQNQLQLKNQECQNLKSQVIKLQKDVTRKPIKSKKERSTSTGSSNQTESCMTDIITEKTRMLKNQELQIEALTQQVNSLKEVINIAKDMLDIRNIEVKQLHDKLNCMEMKFDSEKDRHETVQSKLERMVVLNTDLKNEYKKQLYFISELQKSYQEHITNCKKNLVSDKPSNKSDIEKFENKDLIVKESVVDCEEVNEKPAEKILETSNATNTNKDEKELSVQAKGDTEIMNTPKANTEFPITDTQINNEDSTCIIK